MSSAWVPMANPAGKATTPTSSIRETLIIGRDRVFTSDRSFNVLIGRDHGFTLIEVLAVALIIGLTLGLVAIKLQPNERELLRDEALRLSALLTQARDEAITTGASLAWRGDPSGYTFLRRAPDRTWQPFGHDEVFRRRELRAPLALTAIEISGRPAANEDFIVFSSAGIVPQFRITLALNAERLAVRADHPTRIEIDDSVRR